MGKIELKLANQKDLEDLVRISINSFHTDITCGADEEGGPPGYDSIKEHKRLMNTAKEYLKITYAGEIIGGAIIFNNNEIYCLGRIYIDPKFQRQTLGLKSIGLIFERYPDAKIWKLETPKWNRRTRNFYKKLGFNIVKETDEIIFFEKHI